MRELLIFHPDQHYLEDISPLQRYIRSELNVRDVVFSSDEARAGVKYKATADWPVLGKKLRKDINLVKSGLPLLSSEDVKRYLETGKIIVGGIELVQGDLAASRYVEHPESNGGIFSANSDNDVVVVLDIQVHSELIGEGLARELINRVQRLRKKANLQPTDDVDMFYVFENELDAGDLKKAANEYEEMIRKALKATLKNEQPPPKGQVISEDQEITEIRFRLTLVKL